MGYGEFFRCIFFLLSFFSLWLVGGREWQDRDLGIYSSAVFGGGMWGTAGRTGGVCRRDSEDGVTCFFGNRVFVPNRNLDGGGVGRRWTAEGRMCNIVTNVCASI